jgi:hypothetical protein
MKDDVGAGEQTLAIVRVANVAGLDRDPLEIRHVVEPAPRVEGVVLHERRHTGAGTRQGLGQVRSDEPVGTGDDYLSVGQWHRSALRG